MSNYTIYHCHTMYSILDSVVKYEDYLKKISNFGMTAFGVSEHGNVFNWTKKKYECEKYGIKYIHAQEFYVTEDINIRVRDNWHCVLIAKNLSGVKELNRLSSIAHRRDGHYYYDPRISFDELINTSSNIIITTACLGGILNYNFSDDNNNIKERFIEFMANNADRCFLEIQHHSNKSQVEYNKKLYDLRNRYGIKLIAGTDTHSIDDKSAKLRDILQKSKNINFENEEGWDLNLKTYEQLVECYEIQDALPKSIYIEAIENTNRMANMVEEFSLDFAYKYPKIYEDSDNIFREKVYNGLKERGLENNQEYIERIEYETKAIDKNGAKDYLLLQEKITSWCKSNGIFPGYSRGSVSGCLCAYLLGITDIDSIKFGMSFERFMNEERISLSDIDVDYPPNKREEVKDYIFNSLGLNCSDIVAFNSVAFKGAIRDVGRALDVPLEEINDICKTTKSFDDKHKKVYDELFYYARDLEGTITSSGVHPCGVITTTLDIDEELGTFTTSTDTRPISQVDMKGVDSLNFVKLDILGLDNIQVINETCELAGIERLMPDNVDFEDSNVWQDMLKSNLGIFQFESDFANQVYKKMFDEKTLEKIKKQSGSLNRIALFSMANGALRPAGESYRDYMAEGKFRDNGHVALNEMLKDTMGYLVYQEDVIRFLNEFCGYTMGEADVVRRGFAKKVGTEEYIPKIKSGFIKTMKEKYDTSEEDAKKIVESFLRIIEDASFYLFSLNHSLPYSMIAYVCGYLRYYYKIEFLTTMLNINKDDLEKSADIISYAKECGIKVRPPKFRFAKSSYFYDKKNNTIYKDVSSIKFVNEECGKSLYEAGKLEFKDFLELLVYIEENLKINSRQMSTLIKLNFFEEFGRNKKLLQLYDEFSLKYKKKLKEGTKQKRIAYLRQFEKILRDEFINVSEQIKAEKEALGYVQTTYDVDKRLVFVNNLDTRFAPRLEAYCLGNGTVSSLKVYKKTFADNPFEEGDLLYCKSFEKRRPIKFIEGEYLEDANGEEQWWLTNYIKVKPNEIDSVIANKFYY